MSASGFVLRHRLERDRRPPVLARPVEQGLEKRLGGRFLAAEAQHREHGRRARRPKQLLEQDGTIRVGPLQVVDPDDKRPASRQPAQQLAQRLECPPPKIERIDAPGLLIPAGVRDGVHLQQHGEHLRQRRHIGRHQPLDMLAWNRREIAAQVIDDPIERLVRHRLVLVASAGEHDDIVARAELTEKALYQRALADA